MKTIRRTKIRLETHELTIMRTSRNTQFFCEDCQTETAHLPLAQFAAWQMISERIIFYLAETRQIHSFETPKGQLLICAASAAGFEKEKEEVEQKWANR